MPKLSRRNFLKSSALSAAAIVGSSVNAASSVMSAKTIQEVESLEAKKTLDSTAKWGDGLAHPIPYKNPPGIGKDRALVLGGGSEYMSSFLVGYFHAMQSNGVNLKLSDIVVGTSAGAIFGSALLGGRMDLLSAEFNFLADYPHMMAKFVPTQKISPSQERVIQMGRNAKDGSSATIQAIGHAAMAAKSIPSDKFEMNMKVFWAI